jgi:hypothetical protein
MKTVYLLSLNSYKLAPIPCCVTSMETERLSLGSLASHLERNYFLDVTLAGTRQANILPRRFIYTHFVVRLWFLLRCCQYLDYRATDFVHALHKQLLNERLTDKAVSLLKWLVAGFPPRRPGFASGQVMWDLWWTKWHWCRFSPNTLVSSANHHSTKFSILIITRGRYNRPICGRRVEWTPLDFTPHNSN